MQRLYYSIIKSLFTQESANHTGLAALKIDHNIIFDPVLIKVNFSSIANTVLQLMIESVLGFHPTVAFCYLHRF